MLPSKGAQAGAGSQEKEDLVEGVGYFGYEWYGRTCVREASKTRMSLKYFFFFKGGVQTWKKSKISPN